jgi:RNA polymerase sigma factor (sigma-70 family)
VQPLKQNKSLFDRAMDDVELVNECKKGNPKAQKALFDKFTPKMFVVCLRYLKQTDQAEDALQDGMIKVFSKIAEFKNEGALEGWIRRIIVNTCLDQIRKNLKFQTDVSLCDIEYKLEYKEFTIENMMAEDLMKIIQAMPQGYKVVFNLFAIEGYSHQEIAAALAISESTSKSQYLRARAYLRDRIEKR